MSVAVLIPFSSTCTHRCAALEWVTGKYMRFHPDWQIVIGRHAGAPWCKAAAVADALERTDADMLVIADADVWCDNLDLAAENCSTWAVPHLRVHRLDHDTTDLVHATGEIGPGRSERPYVGHPGGGIVVIRRSVYESCPIDPRFVGWGQEDDAWALALTTLHGTAWRGSEDLIHLWHPPQDRLTRSTGSAEGRALFRRYQSAIRQPGAMRSLVHEHMLQEV